MIRRLGLRAAAVAAGVVVLVVGLPAVASAHPLGNFTVNRYNGIVVSTEAVTLDNVLDVAEISTAQRAPAIDRNDDGRLSRAELRAWAPTACATAARSLRLTVDGVVTALQVTASGASTRPGQAALPILRVECTLRAPITLTGRTTVQLVDTAAGGDIGWRETIAQGDGTTLVRSDVPTRTSSARLTAYPKDLLTSPLAVSGARLTVIPGGPRLAPAKVTTATAGPLARGNDRLTLAFGDLLAHTQGNPWLGVVAVVAALLLGAAHAVAPGHGKTIMAFYLSGRRDAALRSAATVGASVTVTHTAGVLVLGVLVSAGTAFVPARVYPWLSVVSGVLVVTVGLALLREAGRRTRSHADGRHAHGLFGRAHSHAVPAAPVAALPVPAARPLDGVGTAQPARRALAAVGAGPSSPAVLTRSDHDHDHPHHDHPHHDHPHHDHSHHDHSPHGQSAAGASEAPPSRRQLVAMGLAGGLLPSPSALLVLLGAVGLGRPWFGVALVVTFGVGMATTLAAAGLLVMRLRDRAETRLSRDPAARFAPALRLAPVLTAVAVVVLGGVLAWRGLGATGIWPA